MALDFDVLTDQQNRYGNPVQELGGLLGQLLGKAGNKIEGSEGYEKLLGGLKESGGTLMDFFKHIGGKFKGGNGIVETDKPEFNDNLFRSNNPFVAALEGQKRENTYKPPYGAYGQVQQSRFNEFTGGGNIPEHGANPNSNAGPFGTPEDMLSTLHPVGDSPPSSPTTGEDPTSFLEMLSRLQAGNQGGGQIFGTAPYQSQPNY